MPLSFSFARLGPLVSLLGGLLALLVLVLPPGFSEIQGIVGQGTVDLLVLLALLAALAVLSFSAAALFFPLSPLLRGLGLLAASVGLLAQLDVFLTAALNTGMTLDDLPQIVSVLSSPAFHWWIALLPFLGFLLSGWGIARGAPEGEQRPAVSLHRHHVSASRSTDPPTQENPWQIGRRQILAMIVGVLIYSVLSNLSILWDGPGETNMQTVFPAIVLSVFLGIRYGPWVGLVTGALGSVLPSLIGTLAHLPLWVLSNYAALNSVPLDLTRPPLSWPWVVGSALVGFLAGLPLLGTPGREMTVRSVLAITIRSTLTLLVAFALMVVLAEVGLLFRCAFSADSTFVEACRRAAARPLSDLQGTLASEALPTLLVTVLLLPLLFTLLPAGSGGESVVAALPEGAP
ncbi:MAG TPA: hypothetical protein VHZ51_01340, partial [Ktedonobacteraceae bacterium]|nr:hypothetical protein [Ktedonobacteraceae bacterium]